MCIREPVELQHEEAAIAAPAVKEQKGRIAYARCVVSKLAHRGPPRDSHTDETSRARSIEVSGCEPLAVSRQTTGRPALRPTNAAFTAHDSRS